MDADQARRDIRDLRQWAEPLWVRENPTDIGASNTLRAVVIAEEALADRDRLRETIRTTCNEFVAEHGAGVESDWLLSRLLPALDRNADSTTEERRERPRSGLTPEEEVGPNMKDVGGSLPVAGRNRESRPKEQG